MTSHPKSDSSTPALADTYCEAFSMKFARLLVTAIDTHWLQAAAGAFCGYGTSVIGCDAECGIERGLLENETPDGRPGLALLAFAFSREALAKAVLNRAGQCLMTCPTSAVFNGGSSADTVPLGSKLRFFGDGFQKSKLLGARRFWRVPVMDGEFICEESISVGSGVAGGNIILCGSGAEGTLAAAREAVAAISKVEGCITPFPGGVARSGSKVGSRYKEQVASTNEAYCPALRGRVQSNLPEAARFACEIVVDGVDEAAVREALAAGIQAVGRSDHAASVIQITAGNYGGKLGKFLIPLSELI